MKQQGGGEELIKSPCNLFQPTIAKIAVSQICQSIGFTGSTTSALNALSNIATRYLQTLAKSASFNASSCNRTQTNLFDIVSALEDLNSARGYNGATNMNKSLLKSATLRELMKFVDSIDEIPFAKPIPRREMCKKFYFNKRGCERLGFQHVPHWLPGFPDPSTYKDVDRVACEEVSKDELVLVEPNVEKSDNVAAMKAKSFLPVEREKVRFKLGVDTAMEGVNVALGMRNGVCRGGKRVSWCKVSEKEDIQRCKRRR